MNEAERAKRAELVGGGEGVGEGKAGHAHERGGASEASGAPRQASRAKTRKGHDTVSRGASAKATACPPR